MTARNIINAVYNHANSNLFERSDEIKNILACLIAGQHAFFLGLPGVAKSLMITTIMACCDDARVFIRLMTSQTTNEEVFGPLDFMALKDGDIKYKTDGFLADTEVAFLDECFKANSQTLNALLTAMNERKFDDGNARVDIPLISMFGASNELPQDDSLKALYDRFMVRMDVKPLADDRNFARLLTFKPSPAPKILNVETILQAREEASQIDISELIPEIVKLKHMIEHDASLAGQVYVSDRRWREMIKFLKARIWMEGGNVSELSLTYLLDCLWEKPEQREAIAKVLSRFIPESLNSFNDKYDQATFLVDEIQTCALHDVASNYKQLKQLVNEMKVVMQTDPSLVGLMSEKMDTVERGFATSKARYMQTL